MHASSILLLLLSLSSTVHGSLQGGYPSAITREITNKSLEVYGRVPTWLRGYLVRQACHAFGDQASFMPHSKITHFFDCMSGVATFLFTNSSVTYSNRYFSKTHSHAIWNYFGRDFKNSKVSWRTLFTDMDSQKVKHWESRFTEVTGYFPGNPTMNFWRVGQNVQSVSEGPYGLWLDVGTLAQYGPFPFLDDHLDLPEDVIIFQVAAHPARDSYDDSLWTTGIALAWKRRMLHRVIIRIKDQWREIVAAVPLDTNMQQEKCGDNGYSEMASRPGYVHSVALTQNYMIIPVSSYLVDPCVKDDIPKPFFKTFAEFHPDVASKLLIYNRESTKFEQISFTPGFFAQNLVNAFEDEYAKLLHVDILLYDNADLYEKFFQMENLLTQKAPERGTLTRFTIDTRNFLLVARQVLGTELRPFVAFPTINPNYKSRHYQYTYLVANPFFNNSCVEKLNIADGAVDFWCPGPDQYPQESIFVPEPNSLQEDAGVLLVPIFDSRTERGQLAVLEASTMEIMAGLELDYTIPFGMHGQFFTLEELGRSATSAITAISVAFLSLTQILVFIYSFTDL